jgi:hypothetical protein
VQILGLSEVIMSKKICRLCSVLITLALGLTSCQSFFNSHVTPAPTPQCVEPTLTLGSTKFRVESVTREGNGFPEIPKRKKEVAFWVEGTTINYVFGLSPTKENLSLDTVLKTGDPMVINWADCSQDEYALQSIETASAADAGIFDQSTGGLTVYVADTSTSLVIHGERPTVQSAETSAPIPENAIQIDLQILEFTQPDDQTIQFRIGVTNQGSKAISLTSDDIALKLADGSEVPPQKVEPGLPQEIEPGDTLPLTLTFPKPQASSAVLRILDVTFEYYFQ